MEKYKWRIPALVAGIIELIVPLLLLILMVTLWIYDGKAIIRHSNELTLFFMVSIMIIGVFGVLIEICVASVLIRATARKRDASVALGMCENWRLANITFIIVSVVISLVLTSYIASAVNMGIRMIYQIIVEKFMGELREAVKLEEGENEKDKKINVCGGDCVFVNKVAVELDKVDDQANVTKV